MTLDLHEAIRKRHPAPAWAVIEEVSNATGSAARRRADVLAIGLWPSHGHAVHGFELKASLGDLRREFDDPTKADAVGGFCDYWWLVVTDAKIAEKVAIPETWGVLAPRGQVLQVVRKAPKREPKAMSPGFAAAVIRRVAEGHVPRSEYKVLEERMDERVEERVKEEIDQRMREEKRRTADLEAQVEAFKRESGVTFGRWDAGNIGEAVAEVVRLRHELGRVPLARDIRAAHLAHIERQEAQMRIDAARLQSIRATIEQLPANDGVRVPELPDVAGGAA